LKDKAELALQQAQKDDLGARSRRYVAVRLHKHAARERVKTWTQRAPGADARIAAVKSSFELWKRLPGAAAIGSADLYSLGITFRTETPASAVSRS
jgi:hypothetical protein